MNRELLTVIELFSGSLVDVKIYSDIENAENSFREKIKTASPDILSSELESYLDDGHFESGNNKTELFLSWGEFN